MQEARGRNCDMVCKFRVRQTRRDDIKRHTTEDQMNECSTPFVLLCGLQECTKSSPRCQSSRKRYIQLKLQRTATLLATTYHLDEDLPEAFPKQKKTHQTTKTPCRPTLSQ